MREGLKGVRGGPFVKRTDRVGKYWSERVGRSRTECAERECKNKEG